MRVFFDITNWGRSLDKLDAMGKEWETYEEVKTQNPLVSSPIVYFKDINGDDVAYLVYGIGLTIFDKPRKCA